MSGRLCKKKKKKLVLGVERLEGRHLLSVSHFVINEVLADPDATTGDANRDGTASTSQDEFVEIVNTDTSPHDISNWTLADGNSVRHTFPSPTVVGSGQAVVVFAGGNPVGSFGGAIVQTASGGSLGLNNGGDTITLSDGTTSVVETFGSEGGNNQALTRNPDLVGSFVEHMSLPSGLQFSPGFQNDGATPFSAGATPPSGLTVTQSGGATLVEEGGATDTVDVVLVGTPTGTVTVTLTPSDAQIDLGSGPGAAHSLSFTASNASTAQTVTVAATDDTVVEGSHSSGIDFLTSSGDATFHGLTVSPVSVVIQDNDLAALTIWINEFHYDNGGTDTGEAIEIAGTAGQDLAGAELVFYNGSNGASYDTIELSGLIPNQVGGKGTLSFATTGIQNGPDGIALINTDGSVVEFISYEGSFVATNGPADGMTSTDIGVFESDSTQVGESLQRASNSANGSWSGPNPESFGDLNSPPPAQFEITANADAFQREGDIGNTPFTFQVTRSANTIGSNSVSYAVSSLDADAVDFGGVLPNGTLTFAPNESTKTITINVAGDTEVEDDEDFTVTLSGASSGAIITAASANGTIENDDALIPDFSIVAANAVQAEGDEGTTPFTFEVTRTGDITLVESIDFTVTSNEADATDFGLALPIDGVLAFSANETTKTITVDVVGDTTVEPDEEFTVTLSNSSGGGTISIASAVGTIENDDVAPVIPPLSGVWINEFHYDNVGGDVGEGVEIAGPAGTDLAGASIVLYNGSDGQGYETVTLGGVIDNEVSGIGALFFPISGIQNGPDGIAFVNNDGSLIEFISYEGEFVAADGPANGVMSVDVGVIEDSSTSIGESLQRLDNTSTDTWTGPLLASPGDLNRFVAAEFSISPTSDFEYVEGDSGTTPIDFVVSRRVNTATTHTIDYSMSPDSETDAADFGGTLPGGTLTFLPGETTKTITLNVSGDTDVEPAEDVIVLIGNASGGGVIVFGGAALATIDNDDVLTPDFSIIAANAVQAEGDSGTTPFTFEVTRTGDATLAESVDFEVSSTEADAADFGGTLPGSTLSFAANESTKTIAIQVAGDMDVEPDESFTVTLSNASRGGTISTEFAIGTIRNDDVAPAIPPLTEVWINEFHYDNVGGDEGEGVEIAGEVGSNLDGASIVLYNGSNGEAYRTISLSGVIDNEANGIGALFFAISGIQQGPDGIALVNNDGSLIEFLSYEASFIAVDGPASGVTSLDVGVREDSSTAVEESLQRVNNTSTDSWSGPFESSPGDLNAVPVGTQLGIAADSANKDEGDSGVTPFTFTVTRTGNVSAATEVDWGVSSGEADEDDFGGTLPGATLSFSAGETSKTITANVSGDTLVEADENFTVTLSDPSGGATLTNVSATGTIQNDDVEPVLPPLKGVWINEFHYDNGGSDLNEGVEIAGPAGADLSGARILLYNGGSGTSYREIVLSGTIDNESGGNGALFFDIAGIQNGAPDGLAFVNNDGSLIEFLSYEGSFTGVGGPADGVISEDVGVAEGSSTTGNESLQRVNNTATDSWSGPFESSPGDLNEAPLATELSIAAATASKKEGDSGSTAFTFTITRTGDTSGTTEVDWIVSSTEANADDFGGSFPGATVSFAARETSKSITINVSGDTDVEADEVFIVELSDPSGDATIATDSAMGTIQNDDVIPVLPPLKGVWINEFHYDNGGGDQNEGVEIAGPTGTNLAGASVVLYNGSNGQSYGETILSGTIDNESGGEGALFFAISGMQNGPDGIALVDTDGSLIEFISYEGSFMAVEGPADGVTSVDAGVEEGSSTKANQSIQRVNNTAMDSWSGPFVSSPGDLNEPPLGTQLSITASAALKEEGDSGDTEFTFEVTRTGDTSGPTEVDWAVTGGVANADDFGGALPGATLSFAAGEAIKPITVEVSGDDDVEPDEDFAVTLSDPSDGATLAVDSASGTIRNDDEGMATTPVEGIWINEFHYDNSGGDENEGVEIAGAAGTNLADVKVVFYNGGSGEAYKETVLSGVIDEEASGKGALFFEISGIQNGGPDGIALVNTDGSLIEFLSYEGSFEGVGGAADGVLSTDVHVVEDSSTTEDESLQRANNIDDDVWVGPFASSPGDLNDSGNGQSVGTQLSISALDADKPEGDSGTTEFTFEITRSGNTSLNTDVDFTITFGETDEADFADELLDQTITFEPGEKTKVALILIAGDEEKEPDETFTVSLADPSGGAELVGDFATGTIRDDDDGELNPTDDKPQAIWINEFHYDNAGPDENELIEVAGIAGTDLEGAQLVLYNGSNGEPYRSIDLAGEIADLGNGLGVLVFDAAGIQNGPDAIALIGSDGTLIEFLSYEGAFTATDGPAAGTTSVDIGVFEVGGSAQSLQRLVTGWSGPVPSTFGELSGEEQIPVRFPSLEIEKRLLSINGTLELHHDLRLGDELLFGFDVRNSGAATLEDVVVTDSLPTIMIGEHPAVQIIAFQQEFEVSDSGSSGVVSTVDGRISGAGAISKVWDNFSLDKRTVVDAVSWVGAYSQALEDAAEVTTDFTIEFFEDVEGLPGEAIHAFSIDGSDEHAIVTSSIGHGTGDGGPMLGYHTELPFTVFARGDYWISISADQTAPSVYDAGDWNWYFGGSSEPDGFLSLGSDSAESDTEDGDARQDSNASDSTLVVNEHAELAFAIHALGLIEFDGVLGPDEEVMFLGTYVVGQDDIDSGNITSSASATAGSSDGIVMSKVDAFGWTINHYPSMGVSKQLVGDEAGAPVNREAVSWVYEVVNNGNVSLSNVDVIDHEFRPTHDPASDLNGDGILSPNETWLFHLDGLFSESHDSSVPYVESTSPTGAIVEAGFGVCHPNLGDVDGDGFAEFRDFLILANNFGSEVPEGMLGDVDCNGEVDFLDFLVLAQNFGRRIGQRPPTESVEKVFEQRDEVASPDTDEAAEPSTGRRDRVRE